MKIILVAGPPSSGKTTYVQANRKPGDLVVDYDALAVALGSDDAHDHPHNIKPFAAAARAAVLRALEVDQRRGTAWVIECEPRPETRKLADETITMTTTYERVRGGTESRRSGSLARPQAPTPPPA